MISLVKAFIILVVFVPFVAFAATEEAQGHHVDIKMELFRVINFLIFLVLVYKFAGKAISGFFRNRAETIKKGLEEAERAYNEATEKYNFAKQKIENLDVEIQLLFDNAKREAEEQVNRIKEETEAMIKKIKEQAASARELEVRHAKRELELWASELAVSMAKDVLGKAITELDHKKLIEEYINKVKEVH